MLDIEYHMYYNILMTHAFSPKTRRNFLLTGRPYGKRSKYLRAHPELVQRYMFILVTAICGFALATAQILPKYLTSTPTLVQKVASPHSVEPQPAPKSSGATQDNPLFATSPSWFQNYKDQTSGILDSLYFNTLVGPASNSNAEKQYYTADASNLRIENGALRLIATHQLEPDGYSYGSARVETQGKKSFLYGRFDITAKLPSGSGSWPAIWLLPANDVYASKSPDTNFSRYKNGGELDIMEAVGYLPDKIYGIAHTVSDVTDHPDGTGTYNTINVSGSNTSFNIYTLLWTPTTVTFEVNGMAYFTYARQDGASYTTWPFDQPFYMIINLAMGGSWGGVDTAHYPGNGIDDSSLPTSLDIQSINYYPYVGSTSVK